MLCEHLNLCHLSESLSGSNFSQIKVLIFQVLIKCRCLFLTFLSVIFSTYWRCLMDDT